MSIKLTPEHIKIDDNTVIFIWKSPVVNISHISGKNSVSFSFNLDNITSKKAMDLIHQIVTHMNNNKNELRILKGDPRDLSLVITFDSDTVSILKAIGKVFDIGVRNVSV